MEEQLANLLDWFAGLPGWLAKVIETALGLLSPDQWDAWRNWLATIGGLIALSVAVATYTRNVRMKREEAARLVYATVRHNLVYLPGKTFEVKLKPDDLLHAPNNPKVGFAEKGRKLEVQVNETVVRVTIIVHNASRERISPVFAHAFSRSAGEIVSEAPAVENVDPESTVTIEVIFAIPPAGQPEVGVSLIFRDSSGRWWKRHLDGPLRRARRVRVPAVRGVYYQLDPSYKHPAIRPDDHDHAVGMFRMVDTFTTLRDRLKSLLRS